MGQLRLNDRVYTGQASSDGFHIYSTNEQIVGKWIDGSTLYEKTIEATISQTYANIYEATGISVREFTGTLGNDNGLIFAVPFVDSSDCILLEQASGYVVLRCTSWFLTNANKAKVTIRYTKSS